jgi:putative transcriptional regulator
MTATLIRWRLSEVMARHRVAAKDLAKLLGVSNNAISNLRNADVMPRIDGTRLEQICVAISRLSRLGDPVSPHDLIEYVPELIVLPGEEEQNIKEPQS